MEDGAFLMWIREVKAITDTYDVPLIINDRIHLALLTGAQGVHMGQGDLPTAEAKRLLAPWQWLGRSTHGMHQAQPAVEEGLDYLGVGPLYLTQTKEHREAVGLGYMRQVEDELDIPYVGIGAVNRKNLPAILVEKPTGLAICTAIIGHDDPKGETAFYLEQMKQALL
jgi:thiamine-phosphate pyrophosphorylase